MTSLYLVIGMFGNIYAFSPAVDMDKYQCASLAMKRAYIFDHQFKGEKMNIDGHLVTREDVTFDCIETSKLLRKGDKVIRD